MPSSLARVLLRPTLTRTLLCSPVFPARPTAALAFLDVGVEFGTLLTVAAAVKSSESLNLARPLSWMCKSSVGACSWWILDIELGIGKTVRFRTSLIRCSTECPKGGVIASCAVKLSFSLSSVCAALPEPRRRLPTACPCPLHVLVTLVNPASVLVVVPCVIKKSQESGEDEASSVIFTKCSTQGLN
jgi:hypothetical protein